MNQTYRSIAALEKIARRTLKDFNDRLLYGPPSAVPIEKLAAHLGLWIEYQCIRKNGIILGEMVYENTLVPLYLRDIREYQLVPIDGKTIILDESLLKSKTDGRLRFTCAHEIAHWLLHKELYAGTGYAAALGNPKYSSEENPAVEWQANKLGSMLLLPTVQTKKAFYSLQDRRSPVVTLKNLFDVSSDAMKIFLQEHNLI
jgi:hypothetical protein